MMNSLSQDSNVKKDDNAIIKLSADEVLNSCVQKKLTKHQTISTHKETKFHILVFNRITISF